MLRKFLLTGLPLILNTLVPDSSELSVAVGLLASMIGMVSYAAASPFTDEQDTMLMVLAQIQVTFTMICGLLMEMVHGNPVGELAISLVIIVSFLATLGFGAYLCYNPDCHVASYIAGTAIVRVLGPHLGAAAEMTPAEKTEKMRQCQVAVQLVLNPNYDMTSADAKRLAGEESEFVLKIVNVVRPLIETGSIDSDDIVDLVEELFQVCSGISAKCSRRIVGAMASKALALAGMAKGNAGFHAIEVAVGRAVDRIAGGLDQ